MGVIALVQNVGAGAWETMEFGTKGVIAGAGVGLASYGLGEHFKNKSKDENGNSTLGGALMAGAVAGTMQSAFSSMQELYAFNNPTSVVGLESMNNTTTATAKINAQSSYLQADTYKQLKNKYDDYMKHVKEEGKSLSFGQKAGKAATIIGGDVFMKTAAAENVFTDLTKLGMINDSSGDGGPLGLFQDFTSQFEEADKAGKAGSITDMAKSGIGALYDDIKNTIKAADHPENTKWFSTKPTEINIPDFEALKFDDKGELMFDEKGDAMKHKVSGRNVKLTGLESINERSAKYVEAYKEQFDQMFNLYDKIGKNLDVDMGAVKNTDDYIKYLNRIEPGALGTYRELKRAGIYADDAPITKKLLGYAQETFNGSPIWARTLDKQMKAENPKDKAEIMRELHVSDDGKNVKRTIQVANNEKAISEAVQNLAKGEQVIKNKNIIKGGNKVTRALALVADSAVIGGGLMAAAYGVGHIVSAPFENHKNKNNSSISSNYAINQI